MDDVDEDEKDYADAFRREICAQPAMLHRLVLSSYFDNWRMYLRHLGDRFSERVHMGDRNLGSSKDPMVHVRELRNTNDLALFASACCQSNLEVTDCILLIKTMPDEHLCEFQSMQTMLRGFIESSQGLRQRIDNTVELVCCSMTDDSPLVSL